MLKAHPLLFTLALALPLSAAASPANKHYRDARTGLDAWQVEDAGVRIQLIQRLPDQTRAFFLGRGFPKAAAERIAQRCVLQTIVTNTAGPHAAPIHVDLHDWAFRSQDGFQPLLLKAQWQQQWKRLDVPHPARLAFQWALFPTRQVFTPGDWNMGMTTYPVAPGTRIEVRARWTREGRSHTALIGPLRCAPDVKPEDM